MNTIGPDHRLDLASGLDRIDRQLDDLRRQQGGQAQDVQHAVAVPEAAEAPQALFDAGERILTAPAWDLAGSRSLPGDLALEARLATLPLADAAESAVDAVLDAFA